MVFLHKLLQAGLVRHSAHYAVPTARHYAVPVAPQPPKAVKGLEAVQLYSDQLRLGPYGHDDISLYGFEDVRHHEPAAVAHKVAIIENDGRVKVVTQTPTELSIAQRDVAIFTPKTSKVGQRATITMREGKILVRTELVRAIITRSSAVLFECRRPTQTEKMGLAVHQRVVSLSSVPFELRVLEGLLDQTLDYLEGKASQIKMLSKGVQEDIGRNLNSADIRRMLPLQKAITALQYDIKETQEAIADVAKNDRQLAMVCLSEDQNPGHHLSKGHVAKEWTPHMLLASRLLMAYDRRVKSLDSDVRELSQTIESTREVWHMQLDANRNTIIRLNLHLSFGSMAAMLVTTPAAFFGMNLLHGMEEDTNVFWRVVEYSTLSGVLCFGGLVAYYQLWPARATAQRITDTAALHDLLTYHVDEINDVVEAAKSACHSGQRVSQRDFIQLVDAALGDEATRGMSSAEIALLYRLLDTNGDGWIDLNELYRVHTEVSVAAIAAINSEGDWETTHH